MRTLRVIAVASILAVLALSAAVFVRAQGNVGGLREKKQTITFKALSNRAIGTAPFQVSATASSGLPVSFASTIPTVCTVSGTTVTLVALGTCTIQATQAGDADYAAATPVNQSFEVTEQSQTITFGALSNRILGTAPFTVSATASSGLPVSFASTTSTVCTVSGVTITLVAMGTCTIQATQAGNATYAAATPVNQSFKVTQQSQTITFGALSNLALGSAPFTVSATASSGLPVSFASTTSTVCTVSGTTVTLVAVGICTIQATQAGNATYAAATPVNQSFKVTQQSQTITFGALSNLALGTAPFAVSATASSGLAVSFASTTSTVCTVSGATVTLVAVGTCTIRATQPGNANYAAATPVSQSFQVTQASQTITFGALSNLALGTAPFAVSATASSGLAVSFASTTSTVCTVSGATVTLAAVGTCTVQATQAGNVSYAAATPVNQSFQVTQGSQTITFGALSSLPLATAPFTISATASSGLAVSFASTTSTVCTVSGATVTLVAVGTCTVQATQTGNANYAAAPPVSQSFQVMQGSSGTFTLVQNPNESCGSGYTCAITLTSSIVAGHLVAWQCAVNGSGNPQNIVSVSNGGTLHILPAGTEYVIQNGIETQAYTLFAGAESGTDTVTFSGPVGGAECQLWDYSYTGTPGLDGVNVNAQIDSSTTATAATFTPSPGSNNDISLQQSMVAYTPASSISSPFSWIPGAYSDWAHLDNTTTAYGPTWTWGSAQVDIMLGQMQFGFNVTPFSNMSFVDFSGTNGSVLTLASLKGNTHGWQSYWQVTGPLTSFTYSTAASKPLQNPTGRLNDGGSYTDSSTTGLSWATSGGGLNYFTLGTTNSAGMPTPSLTAGVWWYSTGLSNTDPSMLDTFVIRAGSADYVNAMSFGNGSTRSISEECARGQNHTQDYTVSTNTWYWVQLTYNKTGNHYIKIYSDANPPVLLTTLSCASTGTSYPSDINFGTMNSYTPTPGAYFYFDSLKISLDGTDVQP